MVTVDRTKKLIGEPATGRETALQYLIDAAAAFAKDYCHIENVDGMDGLLTAMVMEDFNRMGNGGLANQNFSGVSESYNQDYSEQVYRQLRRHRRLVTR